MKTVIFRRKAITFLRITAVLLAAAAFTVGCKTNADDDTGGTTPPAEYTKVDFGTNGEGLKNYLETKASADGINYIEVTGLSASDLVMDATYISPLCKVLKLSLIHI